jgi:hypothetical protein
MYYYYFVLHHPRKISVLGSYLHLPQDAVMASLYTQFYTHCIGFSASSVRDTSIIIILFFQWFLPCTVPKLILLWNVLFFEHRLYSWC